MTSGKPLRLSLTLDGPLVEENRLPVSELVRVARQLRVTLRGIATVLAERGPSGRAGRTERFIEEATDLRVVGSPRAGSFALDLETPPQAHEGHEALPMESDEGLAEQSVEALIAGLDALDEDLESLPWGFDRGVLQAVQPFKRTLARGVKSIVVEATGTKERVRSARIDDEKIDVARKLTKKPVKAQAVAEGKLEMVDFSSLECRIDRPPLPSIACSFNEWERDRVLGAVRKFVRVAGEGEFPPDERHPRKIVAESIEVLYEPLMLEGAAFWEEKDLPTLADEQGVSPFRLPEDLEADSFRDDEEAAALIKAIRGGD